jgi:hypothetical protein
LAGLSLGRREPAISGEAGAEERTQGAPGFGRICSPGGVEEQRAVDDSKDLWRKETRAMYALEPCTASRVSRPRESVVSTRIRPAVGGGVGRNGAGGFLRVFQKSVHIW